jgi:hypothetical protein
MLIREHLKAHCPNLSKERLAAGTLPELIKPLALAAQQTYETMKASGYSWDKAREVAEAELLARPELRPEGDGPSEELQEEAREKEREYLRNPPVM